MRYTLSEIRAMMRVRQLLNAGLTIRDIMSAYGIADAAFVSVDDMITALARAMAERPSEYNL